MTLSPAGPGTPRPAPARSLLVLAVSCAYVLASGAPASAHARLTRATPADGAILTTPPTTVDLWFNELLDDEFNSIAVFLAKDGAPADTTDLVSAAPRVDARDRTHLTTALKPLTPGAYVVQWKVLSRDGHSARGRLQFRVGGVE